MILLEDKNRKYRRYRPNEVERIQLANNGLQWVLSSNVSAVGVNGDDLIIRFHNGSLYEYNGQGDRFEDIMRSNSKGHWVWVNLRRKNVPYRKIGALPLREDITLTDEEIMGAIDIEGINVQAMLSSLGFIPLEQLGLVNIPN